MIFWLNMILTHGFAAHAVCHILNNITFGNSSLDLSDSFDPLVDLTSDNVSDESDILAELNSSVDSFLGSAASEGAHH